MNKDKYLLKKPCSKQCQQDNEAPWYAKEIIELLLLILDSHQQAFGESLLKTKTLFSSKASLGEIIFQMPKPLLAHSHDKDPCLNYVNASAMRLWDRQWHEMIGMPSRMTAPPEEYERRQLALQQAQDKNAIKNYRGVRINKHGNYFTIENARIWTIWNEEGNNIGQAALIEEWRQV